MVEEVVQYIYLSKTKLYDTMFWKQIHISTIYKTLQTQLSNFYHLYHLKSLSSSKSQTTKTSTYLINYILLKFLPSPEFLLIIPKPYSRTKLSTNCENT